MLKIRLQRVGRKHNPSYRIVVTDSKNATQSGKFLEILGNYDPKINSSTIKKERVQYWISNGAQPSDTAHNLFVGQKIIEGKKINVLPKKSPIKKEVEEKVEEKNKEEEKKEEVSTETVTQKPLAEEVPIKEENKPEEKKEVSEAENKPEEKQQEEVSSEEEKK